MYTAYIHITISSETTVGSLLLTDYKYQVNKNNKNHIILLGRDNCNNNRNVLYILYVHMFPK